MSSLGPAVPVMRKTIAAAVLGTSWTAASQSAPQEQALQAAQAAMRANHVQGPASVPLLDQAVLQMSSHYVWIPEPTAGQFMRAIGNGANPQEVGLIFPVEDDRHWMIVASYTPSDHIRDDDAKHWDVEALYKGLVDGTEAANEDRSRQGFAELEVTGWVERPTYDASTKRLIWSIALHEKHRPAADGHTINYNTYALGREGYITLDLITEPQAVARDKTDVRGLLDALRFNHGKRYEDFNSSTDREAAYGLAALVGGVAAKKLGLWAVVSGLLAKFIKLIAIAAVGVTATIKRFFGRREGG